MPPLSMSPIILGQISGQYGVKGWVRVQSHTRPAAEILTFDEWLLAADDTAAIDDWQAVAVVSHKQQAKTLLAKLAGVDDRNQAAALTGRWIAVGRLPKLPAGEYYWRDLIGMNVVNRDGVELGIVDRLLETGANDVLAVRGADNASGTERLLPWSPTVIIDVDLTQKRIRVDWHADD